MLSVLKDFQAKEEKRLHTLNKTKSKELKSRLLKQFNLERKKEVDCIGRMKKELDQIKRLASIGEYQGRTPTALASSLDFDHDCAFDIAEL